MITELPQDPAMLLSFVNMKLRDCYSSLDAMCDDMHVGREDLMEKMTAAGWEYNREANKFW